MHVCIRLMHAGKRLMHIPTSLMHICISLLHICTNLMHRCTSLVHKTFMPNYLNQLFDGQTNYFPEGPGICGRLLVFGGSWGRRNGEGDDLKLKFYLGMGNNK